MKKTTFLVLLGAIIASYSHAQYDFDAMHFSQSILQADARSTGVGGAFGAVGANVISSTINPAGLGLFRKGEFSFSTGFTTTTTSSSYLGSQTRSGKNVLTIPSFGLVFTGINKADGKEVEKGWVSQSFAFNINRTNNFVGRFNYSGNNKSNSILEYFAESAKGRHKDDLPYLTSMAYDTWLIDNPNNPTTYITALDDDTFGLINIDQVKTSRVRGSAYDFNFAFAGNYSNLIYLGAKIGIPFLNYNASSTYSETNNRPGKSNYVGMSYENDLSVSGIGFNAGIGIILKPIDYLRIGGSITSPTFYSLNETYKDKIIARLDTQDNQSATRNGTFDYSLTTPFRATASIAVIAGTFGFISLDYEYVDYTSAFLTSNIYSFNYENNNIENFFRPVSNIRLGGEFKLGDFALRGGYGIYPTPYSPDYQPEKSDEAAKVLSFGFGFRDKEQYIDLAWQNISTSQFETPYVLSNKDVEGVDYSLSKSSIILTLGFKF
ncbi:MAG TPA: hypothetical protein P5265_00885 [Bacteroidia bacterium]|nr:hypothetical protein [Bacteroidia bacterium]HRU67027.1 hypothetical protein [Bacteroidia bacterium]